MNFELATDLWLKKLVSQWERPEQHVFLEVGLGAGDWSFEWASRLGLKCIVVEPAPTEALRAACERDEIRLIEAAVCEHGGTVELFEGELHGAKVGDTNSIRSDWWAAGGQSRTVAAVTLSGLVGSWTDLEFLAIKVDVEGAEFSVLSGLTQVPTAKLPRVVAFEYGGGGTFADQTGGWAKGFLSGTLGCLNLMRQLGYTNGMILDQHAWSPRFFSLSELDDGGRSIFEGRDQVGNILVWMKPVDERCRAKWLLHHHFVQTVSFVSGASKRLLWLANHWRIRVGNRMVKACGFGRQGRAAGQ